MEKKVILVWFRNDLRLHDNEILQEAIDKGSFIIPVYCFDPRYFTKNKFNNQNTGQKRAQFILDSVQNLKDNLQKIGGDLLLCTGLPEEILPTIAAKYDVDEVYHHREVASRETQISEQVEAALWERKINLKHFIGHTLYHKEDLPFPIRDIPTSFNAFKKKIERESAVRKPLTAPEQITVPPHLEKSSVPTLVELGFIDNEQSANRLHGGEDEGIQQLRIIVDPKYSGLYDYTLLSPYIANGCLSPILVYHTIHTSALSQNKTRFTKISNRLLWRDYFRFMLKKYPNVFFKINAASKTAKYTDAELNDSISWTEATTGIEIIDQSILKLKRTGNLPYHLREILATYLLKELRINWLVGASFFEEHLIDFNPSTEYGYWAHVAGVGTSEKDNTTLGWQDLISKYYPKGIALDISEAEPTN
ncbi:deoxyribodipyrimidine photo-lyase [Sphingobacterium hungaricum]